MASRVFLMPTDFSSFWPVASTSPTSTALSMRICQPSRPTFSASMSKELSMAKLDWLAPKPRMAPQGGLLVQAATASMRTSSTR